MNEVRVRVSPNVAKKAMSVSDELSQLGVKVRTVHVKYKAVREVVEAVKTAWLMYSILKRSRFSAEIRSFAVLDSEGKRSPMTITPYRGHSADCPHKFKREGVSLPHVARTLAQ